VRLINRAQAIGLAAALLLGLALSGLDGTVVLLLSCSSWAYAAVASSIWEPSRPPRTRVQPFAFPIRLGVVLCLAGVAAGILQWTASLDSYRTMLIVLVAVFSLILAIGIVLHHPIKPPQNVLEKDAQAGPLKYFALAIVFVLFVGRPACLPTPCKAQPNEASFCVTPPGRLP